MKTYVLILVLIGPVVVQGGVIDTFEVGTQTITADSGNFNVGGALSGLDSSHVLDGRRALTIQGDMSSGSIVANVDTSADKATVVL